MSRAFIACLFISFAWMTLFYLWGRGVLTFIHADTNIASSIPFGYLVLQVVYHIIYLPFYLTRGSYRATAYIWLGIVTVGSVALLLYFQRKQSKKNRAIVAKERMGMLLSAVLILGLAVYISLHVPFYGADTVGYISTMNSAYFNDSMWITNGTLSIHHGLCSMFHFFTMSSLLTGIKPYYISLFTVRIVGVYLFSMILYHIGVIVFQKGRSIFCWPAAVLAILAPTLLMFWGSNYTAEFFYWRINEAKGYCQFVMMPLGFSTFLEMFKENAERKTLWKKQMIVALAAMPISSSSMTSYLFLVLMGTCAVLAFDRFKNGWRTISQAVACAMPNLLYLVIYTLEGNRTIVF